jgi:hypothetical protein
VRSRVVNAVRHGRTIWWAVATITPGSHGDEFDPADFTTTFYERPL